MDILPLLLESDGGVYSPRVFSDEFVYTGILSQGVVFLPLIVDGEVLGHPISTFFNDFSHIHLPVIATPQEVSLNLLGSWSVFEVTVTEKTILVDGVLEDSDLFSPTFFHSISTTFFDAGGLFYPPLYGAKAYAQVGLIEAGTLFDIGISIGTASVLPNLLDSSFVFPVSTLGVRTDPLRLKLPDSVMGGGLSLNYISPSQSYVNVRPEASYDSMADLPYSPIFTLLTPYIPSNKALFSEVFYRAFYVQNDSYFTQRRNIDFWIDGGSVYQIDDKTVYEAEALLRDEELRHGRPLADRLSYLSNGPSSTSLFGQVRVSYSVSQTDILSRFNQSGVGVGIDLNRLRFVPGNMRSRLPRLNPGEYVGIYLRIETQFLPDFPIQSDYSFFHLSYINSVNGDREMYPGQLRDSQGNKLPVILPSLFLNVRTDMSILNSYLREDVRRVYENYPPYFLSLEDIGEYE